jgi:hypothetical protein
MAHPPVTNPRTKQVVDPSRSRDSTISAATELALEARFPGMEHINLNTSLCTPKSVMLEQFQRFAEEVMPAFR